MNGKDVIEQLKKKFRVSTDLELKARIGLTPAGIQQWKNRENVTPRQIAELTHKARQAATHRVHATAIRTVVEFFPIEPVAAPRANSALLFGTVNGDGSKELKYQKGLRAELEELKGVYIFFDSRGQAIYLERRENSRFGRR